MMRLLIFGLLAAISHPAQAANPIFPGADPHAAILDGKLWIYPTHSERGKNFFVFRLTPERTWEKVGPIFDLKDVDWLKKERYRRLGPWAPCIAQKDGKFYFYYSVGPQSEERPSRIGVAVADSPTGPFVDSGKPLLGGGNGFEAIDPMVFEDKQSGKWYFYAGGSAGAKLRVFELADDLVSFRKEIPVETPEKFTEGAFMHHEGGLYHLTYSHGGWKDATYSVHHATAETPVGPWKYRGAILSSDATHKGPGHHSIVQIPSSGKWHIIYHRWNKREGDGPFSGFRDTAIDALVHRADGSIAPVEMTD
ncbi:MAG: family 43 glycosylhydrolase [Verrucomicrobiota bacterium]